MVEYLSGNRIQGSSTLTASPPSTSWKELTRTTLGSNTTTITTPTFTPKDNIMILANFDLSGFAGQDDVLSMGNGTIDTSSTSQFAYSRSYNGGSDSSATSQEHGWGATGGNASIGENVFYVGTINNKSSQEKLGFLDGVLSNTAGATNAPDRFETVAKYVNTSTQINIMKIGVGGNTYASGSELIVLGCDNDEADANTNFWQELASVDTSSSHDVIDTGTFTNKKYLWLQCYVKGGSNASGSWIFNDDTNQTGYAIRRSNNGGADTGQYAGNNPAGSEGAYDGWGATGNGKFYNMFIVNNGSKEALWINHLAIGDVAGSGNAPNRNEVVGKWDLTDAITRIRIKNQDSGTDYDESSIKVWGSD